MTNKSMALTELLEKRAVAPDFRMRRLRPIDFARFRWVMRLREGLL